MIGNLTEEDDPVFSFMIKFVKIIEIFTLNCLCVLINEHNLFYIQFFKESLKPNINLPQFLHTVLQNDFFEKKNHSKIIKCRAFDLSLLQYNHQLFTKLSVGHQLDCLNFRENTFKTSEFIKSGSVLKILIMFF